MTEIRLSTYIAAPIAVCFDLSRSIDVHKISTAKTKEKAIAGRTEGLINVNESVTWEAIHFGIKQNLTVRISAMQRPHFFSDEMLKGAFKSMRHEHRFEVKDNGTLISDIFRYDTPFGLAGKFFDTIILKSYMTKFLESRNETIKEIAETGKWKEILAEANY